MCQPLTGVTRAERPRRGLARDQTGPQSREPETGASPLVTHSATEATFQFSGTGINCDFYPSRREGNGV